MWMLPVVLQPHDVHHIDETDSKVGEAVLQDLRGREGFRGGYIAGCCHYEISLTILITARPVPDADALGAVLDRFVHGQVLRSRLLAGDDDVHVLARAQAMISG